VALCPRVRQGCPASPLMFLLVSARSGRRTAVMRRPPQRPKRQPAAVRDTAEEDTEQLWAERALGPAHREERAAAHAADAARGGTGTDGAEAGGQAHIEERVVGDICAAEVGTQSSLNEQLNKSQLVALCGSEPEADADAGEEGGTTPRSPPSGAKRARARWGDEAEGMGGAGPSGLAASDASDPLAAALLDNKPVCRHERRRERDTRRGPEPARRAGGDDGYVDGAGRSDVRSRSSTSSKITRRPGACQRWTSERASEPSAPQVTRSWVWTEAARAVAHGLLPSSGARERPARRPV
jgi:hypothetical protein